MNQKVAKIVGIITIIFGALFIVTGGVAWGLVTSQLKAENITVPDDSPNFPGKKVGGPLTAYAQAEIINTHALASSGDRTYAELGTDAREASAAGDEELAAELSEKRTSMMNASFLRSSLFTSVLAYGVSLFAMGVGAWMLLMGWALTTSDKRRRDGVVADDDRDAVVVDRDGRDGATVVNDRV